jgi:hypothetical protein
LLERVEDQGHDLGFDPDAGVGELDNQPIPPRAGLVPVSSADRDRAAVGGEFDGVLDQVPEDLLKPRRVGVYMVILGR